MRKNIAIVYVIYLAISTAIYATSFDNLFRDEDFAHLLNSNKKTSLLEVVKPTALFASDRPGALSLFYLEYQLFKLNSAVYLLFNYLLHVTISLLSLRVFLDLGVGKRAAVLGASLFVLGYGHYGKQLMWANNSGPLMAVLITLLTIWATIRWMRGNAENTNGGNSPSLILYPIAVLALLFIGPTVHELTLFTPFFLAVIICTYPGRASQRILKILPFFIPWLMWLALLSRPDTIQHVITEGVSRAGPYLLLYFGFFLAPIQESVIANDSILLSVVAKSATPIRFSAGLLFLAALTVVFFTAGNRAGNPLRIIVIWLVVALFPFCFVELPEGYLELRHLYYASIPFCALVGCALSHLFGAEKLRRKAIAAIFLLLLSIATSTLAIKLERKYDAESRSAVNMDNIKRLQDTIGG